MVMETPRPRNGVHGQGRAMSWRTISVVLLIALGIMTTTAAEGDGHEKISRVVGGHNAEPGEWPWQIALKFTTYIVCGGALISPTWVLSAAHCVLHRNASNFMVLLGAHNLTGYSPNYVLRAVKQIISHPMYNQDGDSGDVALLEMAAPVTYNNYIQPVPLPYQGQEFPDGQLCTLTGWGYTAERVPLAPPKPLQEVQLPLINYTDCNKMFQKALNTNFPIELVKRDMICAGYPEGKKDGCQGDSGGPLVCNNGDSWILVGSVSWGDGCAQPNKPGVYAKTSNFSSWIKQICGVAAFSEMKKDTSTMDISTITTEKTKVEPVCAFEVTNQGTVPTGKMLQMTISFLVGVFVLTRILDVV